MRSFLPDQQSKALHREIIISYGLNVPKASDSLHKNVPVQLPASHDIKSNDGEARTKKPEKLCHEIAPNCCSYSKTPGQASRRNDSSHRRSALSGLRA